MRVALKVASKAIMLFASSTEKAQSSEREMCRMQSRAWQGQGQGQQTERLGRMIADMMSGFARLYNCAAH